MIAVDGDKATLKALVEPAGARRMDNIRADGIDIVPATEATYGDTRWTVTLTRREGEDLNELRWLCLVLSCHAGAHDGI